MSHSALLPEPWSVELRSAAETEVLGSALGAYFSTVSGAAPWVITLEGDLGAGKTTLVRFILRALGIADTVRSPSYTLLEPYSDSRLHFYHFDFYRFTHPEQFLERGFDEYFVPGAICFVEWPDKAGRYLPAADLRILLAHPATGTADGTGDEPGSRLVRVQALTQKGASCLTAIQASCRTLTGAS